MGQTNQESRGVSLFPVVIPSTIAAITSNNTPHKSAPTPTQGARPVSLFHPLHFAPSTFNLIAELTDNRTIYNGDKWVSVYGFPSYVRTCLDRARARTETVNKPSLNVTIAACVSYGLGIIQNHESILTLLQLYEWLNQSDTIDGHDLEELSTFFRSFSVGIVDWIGSGAKQINIAITSSLMSEISTFASNIGISLSIVISISTMVALSVQPETVVPDMYREALDAAMESFFSRVALRGRLAKALLEAV